MEHPEPGPTFGTSTSATWEPGTGSGLCPLDPAENIDRSPVVFLGVYRLCLPPVVDFIKWIHVQNIQRF